ncbi:WxL domain-containing protein [Furfurilactobacillus siliginis]|uniref:Cell surface protein n=1 Tax=Furfurilactobacillus siliginis TaxID=348151 RepID=A0A0R2L3P0_9LACO|nr:WxL domain-containing protein [Furfurilactobacillus siliginis]KRN96367.1 extracellular protein [Furfurilactobacillus siliginis]GEK29220.1 cell surface protein [Furfurilactobacillus siliginis]
MKAKSHIYTIAVTLFCLLLTFTIGIQAATVQREPPSEPPFHIWVVQFTGGFTQQPVSQNVVSGQPYTLNVNTVGSVGQFLPRVTNTWWASTNESATWSQVSPVSGNQNRYTNTVTTDKVQTIYYQVQSTYASLFQTNIYWSNPIKVMVSPQVVHATGFKLDAPYDTLPNGSRTNMLPVLTPSNATDTISWSIDRTDIATIDQTGALVASEDSTKYGPVQVTATTSNGLTAHKTMYVGALQDNIVGEGQDATFSANGFPSGSAVSSWHQIAADGKDTTINNNAQFAITNGQDGTKNGQLTIKNTTMSQNGNHYYATIQPGGVSQTTNTNSARLTILEGNQMTLEAVPNFTFTSLDGQALTIAQIRHGTTLHAVSPGNVRNQTTFDGNDRNLIYIYDPRPHSTGWTLTAALSPFTNTLTHQQLGQAGANRLRLVDSLNRPLTQLPDNGHKTVVKTTGDPNVSWAADLTNSQLDIAPTQQVTGGTYAAGLEWTLTDGPTPTAAR